MALTVAKVRREIAGRVTLPTIIAALEGSSSSLAAMLNDYEANRRAFDVQLAVCEANLRAVVGHGSAARPRIKSLLESIVAFRSGRGSDAASEVTLDTDRAWTIYGSLSGLIEELKRIDQVKQLGG